MPQRSRITVLIPAAGRVPEGVLALSNLSCPAMIPVGGRPVIHWTLRYLTGLGLERFTLAVPRRGLFVEDFVAHAFGRQARVECVAPSRDGGLGFTVLELVEQAAADRENGGAEAALIVLGDTHFELPDPALLDADEPFVLVSPVAESYRWCVAEVDDDGLLTGLQDKVPGLPEPLLALIGVYFFPDLAPLRAAAQEAVAAAEAAGRPAQMADILHRVAARQPIRVHRAARWLDCGNPDRQASSHRSLLQARAFNELSIDPVLGTLTKRSHNTAKLVDEIDYLHHLPPDLAVLFPRVIEASTTAEPPWVRMEYYGYPNLSEVFLFENADPGLWERVLEHLLRVMTEGFGRHRHPLPGAAVTAMYLGKTQARLAALTGDDLVLLVGHPGEIVLNGRPVAGLPALWPRIEAAVETLAAAEAEDGGGGTVIHGDLCLSNILYDLRSGIVKLVDPRGSFGDKGVYGDPRYDVAKLYHSIHGLYDFIVNDLFTVTMERAGGRIALHLELPARPEHHEIRRRFEGIFFPTFDREEVLLITGLLFISMPALHYDAPRRQLAMLTRGLELLNERFATPS
jgi:dTDP-glucose pyrophosphorylase